MKTLSLKERDIIKEETENQREFAQRYAQLASKNHLTSSLTGDLLR